MKLGAAAILIVTLFVGGCASRLDGRDGMDGAGVAAGLQRELNHRQ